MKQMSTYRWIAALWLILLLAACGGDAPAADEPADEPAAEATRPPTTEPAVATATTPAATATTAPTAEPTAEPAVEATEEAFDTSTLGTAYDTYTSYQLNISWVLINTATNEETEFINMQIATVRNPSAQRIVMTGMMGEEMEGDGPSAVELVRLADTQYMILPGFGCVNVPVAEDTPADEFDDLMNADQMLDDVRTTRRVLPNQTINGVETRHYVFDETGLGRIDTTPDLDITGDLYVSVADNQLVRMVMTGYDPSIGEMAQEVFEEGDQFRMTYDLVSINEPITIEIPAGCEAAGESAFPQPDDAYEMASFGNMQSYKTNLSIDEALTFFQTALADAGWTYEEDRSTVVMGTSAFLFFEQDGQQLQLILNADGDVTQVTVIAPEE